jgi:alpha-amylase
MDVLGSFVDNHDNARWLSDFPGKDWAFRSAITFAMTGRGIPFFYYGDE